MSSKSLQLKLVKQRGLVLLALVIIIALAFIAYTISGVSINQIRNEQAFKTQVSLKKAKHALINYAVTHMDRLGDNGEMGFLPCPDIGAVQVFEEGRQELNCKTQFLNSLGYLPWKSLDIPSLRDSSENCLLYAVSNTYKLNPTNLLNDDSNGMFQVVDDAGVVKVGVLPGDRIVAIVFAPGKPLAGQVRNFAVGTDCGMDYDMTAYLEGNGVTDNGVLSEVDNSIDQFIHATTTSAQAATPYNDKFVTITRNEIWSAILARSDFITKMTDLTEALALCLVEYSKFNVGLRRLPWPAPMNLNNQNYRADNNYDDNNGGLYAGRYPFIVNDSNNALGIVVDNIFDTGDTPEIPPDPPTGTNCDLLQPLTMGNIASFSDDAVSDAVQDNEEFRKLWKNWKDHFFYILSRDYEPGAGGEQVCAGNCNRVGGAGGTEYSAIVIFSGIRFNGDSRADIFSGDDDDKADILNYLENDNELLFAAADGSDNYNTVGLPAISNDIMFCVTNEALGVELNVDPC